MCFMFYDSSSTDSNKDQSGIGRRNRSLSFESTALLVTRSTPPCDASRVPRYRASSCARITSRTHACRVEQGTSSNHTVLLASTQCTLLRCYTTTLLRYCTTTLPR